MRFSIIIPTFNRAALVQRAVESVLSQIDTDAEVIVVDDGSTDDTGDQIRQFSGVKLIFQNNAGAGPARNTGAAAARGEYLCFLDADDRWMPWTYQTICQHVSGNVSLLSSMPMPFVRESELESCRAEPVIIESYPDYLASDPVNIFPGAGTMVVRRDAFLRVGGFESTRMGGEDAELFLRLGVEPGFVFVRSPALVGYRMHPGSLSTSVDAGLLGRWKMIQREREGKFPGGAARRKDRLSVITSHCRSGMVVALRNSQIGEAVKLYAATARHHAMQGRWKFLLGFPILAAKALTKRDPRAGQGFLPAMPEGNAHQDLKNAD